MVGFIYVIIARMISIPLMIAAASAVLLTIWFLIIQAETNRGRRLFLGGTRSRLDIGLVSWQQNLNQAASRFGAGTLRLTMHFVMHQLLGLVLLIIKFVETRVHGLRKRNKIVAMGAAISDSAKNHLHHIAEHKESTALTETQKKRLRKKSLED